MAWMPTRSAHTRDERAIRRLRGELAAIGNILPGSVVERRMRCGKASCRCRADPAELHGPYLQWTRRGPDGRTVTRYLSPEQVERYRPWFDNARRIREILSELKTITLHFAETEESRETLPWQSRHRRTQMPVERRRPHTRSAHVATACLAPSCARKSGHTSTEGDCHRPRMSGGTHRTLRPRASMLTFATFCYAVAAPASPSATLGASPARWPG